MEEDGNRTFGLLSTKSDWKNRKELCSILHNLKKIVEYLLTTETTNVWNTYGGLEKVSSCLETVLCHGLKIDSSGSKDFWHYAKSIQCLRPDLAVGVNYHNHTIHLSFDWLRQSLLQHKLSAQLKALIPSEYTEKFYEDYALLRNEDYVSALLICLKAIEHNNCAILADIDPLLLHLPEAYHQSHFTSTPSSAHQKVASERRESRSTLVDEKEFPIERFETVQKIFEKYKEKDQLRRKISPPPPASEIKLKFGHKRSKSDVSHTQGRRMNSDWNKTKTIALRRSSVLTNSLETGLNAYRETDLCNGSSPSLKDFLKIQDTYAGTDLDRENAHFWICEAVIEAIELMKWKRTSTDSDTEVPRFKQRIRLKKEGNLWKPKNNLTLSDNSFNATSSTSGSYDDNSIIIEDEPSNLSLRESGLSSSMGSLFSDEDLHRGEAARTIEKNRVTSDQLCAESVAISLLKKYRECDLPRASDLEWLVSEKDAPQQLLPLPNSVSVSADDALSRRTRIRGTPDWAPPRQQLIYHSYTLPKRKSEKMITQNWRCTGCGSKVNEAYFPRMRFCYYFGKYFCPCCHSNTTFYVPAKVVRGWDFTQYAVSNFACDLIKGNMDNIEIWSFSIKVWNASLYKRVRRLRDVWRLRKQLRNMNDFILTCRFAEKDGLKVQLEQWKPYWYRSIDEYTLLDLIKIHSKEIQTPLNNIVQTCIKHIENCKLCQAKGFICEFCRSNEVLFPFQTKKVVVCEKCRASFHKTCFDPTKCPKCFRLSAKRHARNASNAERDRSCDSDN